MRKSKNMYTLAGLTAVMLVSAMAIDSHEIFAKPPDRIEKEKENKNESEYIIRAWYEGDEPGKEEHRFFEVKDDGSVEEISRKELPEEIRKTAEEVEIFDDEGSNFWFVEMAQFADLDKVEKSVWQETELGDNIFLAWSNWTESTEDPEEEEVEFFQDVAESFYKSDPKGWRWKREDDIGLVSFTVINNGDDYLIKNDRGDSLYRIEDEDLVEIAKCPDEGVFDYYWFL